MLQQTLQRLHFSARTFAAAMLALYLAMAADLPQPYWALMTVYIVSQPLSASVRSKALQRLLGTLIGAGGAVMMLALLRNAPVLLCLTIALWVGGCLALSLLDRTPASYIPMLAGYTAAIIGFGSVGQPEGVFDIALARLEEIMLGTVCASLVHSLWFPQSLGGTLSRRLAAWLAEADRWAIDLLDGQASATACRDRMRLATAATELRQLATHLPYDTSTLRQASDVVGTLQERMLLLIPLLASLGDRLTELRRMGGLRDPESRAAIAQARAWIASHDACAPIDPQLAQLSTLATRAPALDAEEACRVGLLIRLHDVLQSFAESRALVARLDGGTTPEPACVLPRVRAAARRPLHRDAGLALLSGAAATLSILIACTAWIGLGWADGAASAIMAGILCCLFAASDDPSPSIQVFGASLLLAVPLACVYRFLVFPGIDSFPLLVLTLAPALIALGSLMPSPRHALPALVTVLNFGNALALQERLNPDFAQFINGNVSQFFGVFVAIYVTRSLRSMSTDASASRLLAQTWHQLAALADGHANMAPADFASRMVDRLSLLAPRLASSADPRLGSVDALDELRVGMDLVVVRAARENATDAGRNLLDELLRVIAAHYRKHQWDHDHAGSDLHPLLDRMVLGFPAIWPSRDPRVLAALLGLRSKLGRGAPWPPAAVIAEPAR